MFRLASILLVCVLLLGCAHTVQIKADSKGKIKKKISKIPKKEIELYFPIMGGKISSGFGWRVDHFHRGIDIVPTITDRIRAAADGVVVLVGRKKLLSGYGNVVLIRHPRGRFTYYAHLKDIMVKKGQKVTAGQRIGIVGDTGKCNGRHLHFELMFHGKNHDSLPFFIMKGTAYDEISWWLERTRKSINLSAGLKMIIGEY